MITRDFESKIQLTNSGNLSFFFIGTGTSFSKKYLQTNVIIIKGNDHLLIDCGTICSYVMDQIYHTNISEIFNVVVTHPHADHAGGLEELGFIGKYARKTKSNLIISNKFKKILWKDSLRGGLQYSEFGMMKFEDYFNQINPVVIQKKPFEMMQTKIGSIDVKLFRTRHVTTCHDSLKKSQYSQGIIIDEKILYPCDTQFNPEQLKFLCNKYPIELIIHDCDLRGSAKGVHATYEQLKTLPAEMKSKMYLCHYDSLAGEMDPKKDGFAGFIQAGKYYEI